jgi:hypothetical protein
MEKIKKGNKNLLKEEPKTWEFQYSQLQNLSTSRETDNLLFYDFFLPLTRSS